MENRSPTLDMSPLPFLHLANVLKQLPRTGWLRTIEHPESVAAHMYRMALMALCAPSGLDKEKCVLLALAHDMAESVVGDITPHDNVSKEDKFKLEDFGFRYIKSLLDPFDPTLGEKLRTAWLEYEEGMTREAQYMYDVDKLECMIQAFEYEQMTLGEKNLEEFQGLAPKIRLPETRQWLKLLGQERQAYLLNRLNRIRVVFVIGGPFAGKKTHCTLLSNQFGVRHLSMTDIFYNMSIDQTYPHAEFLRDCLEHNMTVPTDLAIKVLEKTIAESTDEKGWVLLRGFPENVRQLVEFEEKLQKSNYTLLLRCSTERALQRSKNHGSVDDKDIDLRIQEFEKRRAAMEPRLSTTSGFFRSVDCNGSEEEVYKEVRNAFEGFIWHDEHSVSHHSG
ncbi:uncharacterized protein PV06_05393 [Exophiala oligosperma]|uniref:5'-deoxynucleotidase n=1 Tax=Exophiala oligosperma TaxID=215243 RepID=A0A0D2AX64_9EURO|nr:uncharacterized protein PV06_05393 [Exophiala oligosperma]KIW44381.1 hypothetical protein PV06_05393 [Exophiala oligosperma]